MYVCIYIYIYAHVYVYVYMYVYICIYIYIYILQCEYIYIYIYTHMRTIYKHVAIWVFIHVHINIYIYIYRERERDIHIGSRPPVRGTESLQRRLQLSAPLGRCNSPFECPTGARSCCVELFPYRSPRGNQRFPTPGLHNKIPALKIFARGWVAKESICLHYQR